MLVQAELGQLRAVLLLKFLNDFLLFVDPFTNMKEFLYEQTMEAYEGATRLVGEALTEKTRVRLDIVMEAPIVILPVASTHPLTFEANLGRLTLRNEHRSTQHYAHTVLTDVISIDLAAMAVSRSQVAGARGDNTSTGTATIVHPISFHLELTRNMEGAYRENDLAEVRVEGTLREVVADMSKEDYNTLIAMVTTNFQEVGVLERVVKARSLQGRVIQGARPGELGVRSRQGRHASQASLRSQTSLQEVMDTLTRDKSHLAKLAEFSLVFEGFGLTIYKGATDLEVVGAARDERRALAAIKVLRLTLEGAYRVSGALRADVRLQDVVLEDVRKVERQQGGAARITKLFEAKKVRPAPKLFRLDLVFFKTF